MGKITRPTGDGGCGELMSKGKNLEQCLTQNKFCLSVR